MGAFSLTGKEKYRTPFVHVIPLVKFIEFGNAETARKEIQPGQTLAIFVEPVQGEAGIYSAIRYFLK